MWFIFERWVFLRHRGSKWLRDSLDDCWIALVEVASRDRLLSAMHRTGNALTKAKASLAKLFRPQPTTEIIAPSDSWSTLALTASLSVRPTSYHPTERPRTRSPSPMPPANPETRTSGHNQPEEVKDEATPPAAMPARRARFVQAIRSVIIAQQGPSGVPRTTPSIFSPEGVRQEELLGLIRSSRVARLTPKLRDFAPTQEFAAHQALVRHLQFSPKGNFLATSRLASCLGFLETISDSVYSWDNTSAIFRTGVSSDTIPGSTASLTYRLQDPFSPHRTLGHSSYVSQVAWSQNCSVFSSPLAD